MSRIWSSGFELNSNAATMEFTEIGGTTSISTTTVRSGTYSGRVQGGGINYFGKTFVSGDSTGPYYFRAYIYISTTPTSSTEVFWINDLAGHATAKIKLNTDKSLSLYDDTSQIGSNSSVLSLNTWHLIELYFFQDDDGTGLLSLTGRINGINFASTTTSGANYAQVFKIGSLGSPTTVDLFIDDIAINDNTGSNENSWAGDGHIIHIRPNADGDNHAFTVQVGGTLGSANNYTRVNEITPDDATSYNADSVLNDIDDFNIDNTPSAIGSSDNINVVQIGVRYRVSVASLEATFKTRCKKVSGGTISSSSAITPNSTSWQTNANSDPHNYALTLYQDPDGGNWTKSTLDTSQIGYTISTGNTNAVQISNIWMLVDYTPISETTTSTTSSSTSSTSSSTSSTSTSSTSSSSSSSTSSTSSSSSTSISTSSSSSSTSSTSSSTSSTSSSSSSTSTTITGTTTSTTSSSTSSTSSSSSSSTSSTSSSTSSTSSSSSSSSTSSTSSSSSTSSTSSSSSSSSTSSTSSSSTSTTLFLSTLKKPKINYHQ